MQKPKHQLPRNTLFVDASVYPKDKVAGWGAVLCNHEQQWHDTSGPLPFDGDSAVCEAAGICLAVEHFMRAEHLVLTAPALIIQCDNLNALRGLLMWPHVVAAKPRSDSDTSVNRPPGAKAYTSPRVANWCKRTREALQGFEIVYVRHVKGHRKGTSGRHNVNERCDALAKQAARAQLG
jgi:ribonuclease HI